MQIGLLFSYNGSVLKAKDALQRAVEEAGSSPADVERALVGFREALTLARTDAGNPVTILCLQTVVTALDAAKESTERLATVGPEDPRIAVFLGVDTSPLDEAGKAPKKLPELIEDAAIALGEQVDAERARDIMYEPIIIEKILKGVKGEARTRLYMIALLILSHIAQPDSPISLLDRETLREKLIRDGMESGEFKTEALAVNAADRRLTGPTHAPEIGLDEKLVRRKDDLLAQMQQVLEEDTPIGFISSDFSRFVEEFIGFAERHCSHASQERAFVNVHLFLRSIQKFHSAINENQKGGEMPSTVNRDVGALYSSFLHPRTSNMPPRRELGRVAVTRMDGPEKAQYAKVRHLGQGAIMRVHLAHRVPSTEEGDVVVREVKNTYIRELGMSVSKLASVVWPIICECYPPDGKIPPGNFSSKTIPTPLRDRLHTAGFDTEDKVENAYYYILALSEHHVKESIRQELERMEKDSSIMPMTHAMDVETGTFVEEFCPGFKVVDGRDGDYSEYRNMTLTQVRSILHRVTSVYHAAHNLDLALVDFHPVNDVFIDPSSDSLKAIDWNCVRTRSTQEAQPLITEMNGLLAFAYEFLIRVAYASQNQDLRRLVFTWIADIDELAGFERETPFQRPALDPHGNDAPDIGSLMAYLQSL